MLNMMICRHRHHIEMPRFMRVMAVSKRWHQVCTEMQRLGFRTKFEIDAGNVETPALVMKCPWNSLWGCLRFKLRKAYQHLPKGCRPQTLRNDKLTPFRKHWAPKLEGPGMLVYVVYPAMYFSSSRLLYIQYTFTHIMPHKFSDIKDHVVPDALETWNL